MSDKMQRLSEAKSKEEVDRLLRLWNLASAVALGLSVPR